MREGSQTCTASGCWPSKDAASPWPPGAGGGRGCEACAPPGQGGRRAGRAGGRAGGGEELVWQPACSLWGRKGRRELYRGTGGAM